MNETKVTVVGLGGCGGNLVSKLEDPRFNRAIFDSSVANKPTFAKDVPLHLLANGTLSGAGKDPARIIKELQAEMPEVVETVVPEGTDLAILVSSTSGGTGSISGQVMLDQILGSKRARAVLCILVPSHESLADVSNTVSCLKNLEAAAFDHQTNVTMFRVPAEVLGAGEEVVRLTPQEQDKLVLEAFADLANLAFGSEGFDQSDLVAFLNPPSLRKLDESFIAGVSNLEITDGQEAVDQWWGGNSLLLSSVTMLAEGEVDQTTTADKPLWSKAVVCFDTPSTRKLHNYRGAFSQILQDTEKKKADMTPKPSQVIRATPAQKTTTRKKFEV